MLARLKKDEICPYTPQPRALVETPVAAHVGEPLSIGNALALADLGGVWVLRVQDGVTLLDHPIEWSVPINQEFSGQRFRFDNGTYDLDGSPRCTGPARAARIFVRCGGQLLYFNGTRAALIDIAKWKIASEAELPVAAITHEGRLDKASMSLGGRTLSLRGETYR